MSYSRPFDNSTWGHVMVSSAVADVSECKNCGASYSDQSLCPFSSTCVCVNARKSGFSYIGTLYLPVFVCSDCGFPTSAFLRAAIEYGLGARTNG